MALSNLERFQRLSGFSDRNRSRNVRGRSGGSPGADVSGPQGAGVSTSSRSSSSGRSSNQKNRSSAPSTFNPDNTGQFVERQFQKFFNRPSDRGGKRFWERQIAEGNFESKDEFTRRFVGGAQANKPGGKKVNGKFTGSTDDQRRLMNDQFFDRELDRDTFVGATRDFAERRIANGQSKRQSNIEQTFNAQVFRDPTQANRKRFADFQGGRKDLAGNIITSFRGDDRFTVRDRLQRNNRSDDFQFRGTDLTAGEARSAFDADPDGRFFTKAELSNTARVANRPMWMGPDGKFFADRNGQVQAFPAGVESEDVDPFTRRQNGNIPKRGGAPNPNNVRQKGDGLAPGQLNSNKKLNPGAGGGVRRRRLLG